MKAVAEVYGLIVRTYGTETCETINREALVIICDGFPYLSLVIDYSLLERIDIYPMCIRYILLKSVRKGCIQQTKHLFFLPWISAL